MTEERNQQLHEVDWSKLPPPQDDGGADHLHGSQLPSVRLPATSGETVDLANLSGVSAIFIYPRTGPPDQPLPEGWDMIPGARGCTPQACAFRDLKKELHLAGVDQIYGLSTQSTEYQREAVSRLHLPFPILSDEGLNLQSKLNLPTMVVEEMVLLKRLTIIARNSTIEKVFYPVFPPDQSAEDVLNWITSNTGKS